MITEGYLCGKLEELLRKVSESNQRILWNVMQMMTKEFRK